MKLFTTTSKLKTRISDEMLKEMSTGISISKVNNIDKVCWLAMDIYSKIIVYLKNKKNNYYFINKDFVTLFSSILDSLLTHFIIFMICNTNINYHDE